MLTKSAWLVITTMFAATGLAQERVLHLTHAETDQEVHEIATDLQGITETQVSVDTAQKALTLHGTAAQITAAEWLANQLDQPANQATTSAASHEYSLSAATDDVVRVFFLAHTSTPRGIQEVATDVRSLADIRRLFTYTASSALVLRGTAAQMALADWLVKQLDQPPNQPAAAPAPHEYKLAGATDDVVHVFFLTHANDPQRLQQIAVDVRSQTQVRRLFTCNAPQAMALRGTAAQIALADRLIHESDR